MNDDKAELLKNQLSQKYDLSFFDLTLGDQIFHLTSVNNIDDLYEALVEKGPEHEDVLDERIPYWADLWHSAIGMAQYIMEKEDTFEGKTVLEIGCGLGLAGVAAARRGGEVILTDYLPEALEAAELVWRMNLPTEPNLQILDWREPDEKLQSDILLASDVAYEARNLEPLLHAFRTLVKPGGKILLSEPGRPLGKEFFTSIQPYIRKAEVISVAFKGFLTKVNVVELCL
ncbi:MAG: methyltransferase domain-containing protein [Bacteroidetes bacterium]|nr:methyltransferase domain-containing protein [Bacteroidota bacterium]